tara:strand:- start:6159 stop:7043 length:885 start_codon:yes stop_codon:yes gene_type:complete
MLSILIPIYNEDITALVKDLSYQCNRQKITYEIICFDDKSRQLYKDKNEVLRSAFRINYVELSENLGRAKIRNWLAKSASFDHFLFLDGDSKLINKSFIKNYVEHLPTNKIIVGGRIYKPKQPKNIKKILHWKYGTLRESLPAQKRQKAGFIHFHSNNFIIPAEIFNKHKFDTEINGYGYEDLVFAQELEIAGYKITHIDNPTRHNKIENVEAFLSKTTEGINNLHQLYTTGRLKTTRLIKTYEMLKKYKLLGITSKHLRKKYPSYESNLRSAEPSIRQFNLWKLYQLIQLMKN